MTATAFATIASPQMIFSGEDDQSIFIEIKIAGWNWLRCFVCLFLPVFCDAYSADTGAVLQFRRDLRQQSLWDGDA
jgi:hypothetical protein